MPLARRVPKRGFHSPFKTVYQVVNLLTLEKLFAAGKLQNGVISPDVLVKLGVVKNARNPVKILGVGEVKSKFEVAAHAFSKSATQKIEAAGGKVQTISATSKE